ncbi:SigE family RNA polymerase sigma factor [uncultured Nocardioides sp.]|uniref:SigE family RNA polymerase sigma factor n=1 Tax=uncultured Nocardioides sp. TaxID=198441 RepID=UPI0026360D84|nr:SigE family RNA polymerase sigma factor [uncultured Nocardioides sp.]
MGEPPTGQPPLDFDRFVADTATRLHRTAVLLCGDHHLAEDLTQTTYAKLFSRWSAVRASTNPVAYARTTLVRTFLSQRRRRSAGERPTDVLAEVPTEAPDTARRLDLLAALAELSPTDRTVLVLRYYDDLSVAQTAHLLGVSEPTLRARSSRAVARLRTRFPDLEDPS